jgi:hypothetical protein
MIHSAHFPTFQRLRLFDTLCLVALGALLGMAATTLLMAATTLIFPELFYSFDFDWNGVLPSRVDILRRVCGESWIGALWGGAMALAFTLFVFLVTRSQFNWRMVAPFLRKMLRVVLVAWLLGGFVAVSWGCLILIFRPQWVPAGLPLVTALRALWAVGSLCGAMLGCGLAMLIVSVQFHCEWKARKKATDTAELMAIRAGSH